MYADTKNRVGVGLSVIYRWSSHSTPRAHYARKNHTQTHTHAGFPRQVCSISNCIDVPRVVSER